jgi:hypothetical protein
VTERYVRERLEAAVWAGLASNAGLDDLKAFLVEFPDGAHASEAQRQIAELKRNALEAHARAERQQREAEAWASASGADDAAALQSFLNDWPDSPHAKAARSRIYAIKGSPTFRLLCGIGAVVCLGPFILGVPAAIIVWVYTTLLAPLGSYRSYTANHEVDTTFKSNYELPGINIEDCRNKCDLYEGCVVAEYSRLLKKCNLYNKSITMHPNSNYDVWVRK